MNASEANTATVVSMISPPYVLEVFTEQGKHPHCQEQGDQFAEFGEVTRVFSGEVADSCQSEEDAESEQNIFNLHKKLSKVL